MHLYQQLQQLNNQELIDHAFRNDKFTEDVVAHAQLILSERILTEEEQLYKIKIMKDYDQLLDKNNLITNWSNWRWVSILNNSLLFAFFIIHCFFWIYTCPFRRA